MILRLFLTALVVALWGGLTNIFSPFAMLITGQQAVNQLLPSDTAYLQTQAVFAAFSGLQWIISAVGLLLLLSIWFGPIKRAFTAPPMNRRNDYTAALAAILAGAMAFAPSPARAYYAQTDYAEWVNIGANQSAFLIPMQGDNVASQGQFGSIEYLTAKKVAAKRVQIPHAKLPNSSALSNYYVPSAVAILVDRTPVYREWTNSEVKGTTKAMEGFRCESADSLSVTTAVAISATVSEAQASQFLYYFGTKPLAGDPANNEVVFASVYYGVSLAEVMDKQVRGAVHASLCAHMAELKLDDLFAAKGEIMKKVLVDVKEQFTPMGISFGFLGLADALDYDHEIQQAINHVYTANKNAIAAASLEPALPVLQQEADMRVKNGIAEGIRTKGIPTLPSFVVLPQSWIEGASAFFNSAGKALMGAPAK